MKLFSIVLLAIAVVGATSTTGNVRTAANDGARKLGYGSGGGGWNGNNDNGGGGWNWNNDIVWSKPTSQPKPKPPPPKKKITTHRPTTSLDVKAAETVTKDAAYAAKSVALSALGVLSLVGAAIVATRRVRAICVSSLTRCAFERSSVYDVCLSFVPSHSPLSLLLCSIPSVDRKDLLMMAM